MHLCEEGRAGRRVGTFSIFIIKVSCQLPDLGERNLSVCINILKFGHKHIFQFTTTSLFISQFQICKNFTKFSISNIVAFSLGNSVCSIYVFLYL